MIDAAITFTGVRGERENRAVLIFPHAQSPSLLQHVMHCDASFQINPFLKKCEKILEEEFPNNCLIGI